MGDLIIKPASGGVLKLQDAGSTDRITVTDGGTTVLNEDGGSAALTINTSGHILTPLQPAFLASLTAQDNLANATNYYFTGTEHFDNGSDLAINAVGTTGGTDGCIFTAPVDGRYQLNFEWVLNDIPDDLGYYFASITTTARTYHTKVGIEPNAGTGFLCGAVTLLADMDDGDTAYMMMYQAGGAAETDFVRGSFSGFLATGKAS